MTFERRDPAFEQTFAHLAQVAMLDAGQAIPEPPTEVSFDAGTRTVLTSASSPSVALSPAIAPPTAMVSQSQFDGLEGRVSQLEGRVTDLSFSLSEVDRRARGGIAAAMGLGGQMVVPESTVSFSINASTFQGEQGFAGSIALRAGERVYISAGVYGSTTADSTGGRVGVDFGF